MVGSEGSMSIFSAIGNLWRKITSKEALALEAKLLGLAASVSTNPAVAAEIAVAAKVLGAASDTQDPTP